VHKAECPGTFVIGPELSTAEALQLAGGGPCAAQDMLSSWTDGLPAIFSGERAWVCLCCACVTVTAAASRHSWPIQPPHLHHVTTRSLHCPVTAGWPVQRRLCGATCAGEMSMGDFAEGLTYTKFKLRRLQRSASLYTIRKPGPARLCLLCRQEQYGGLANRLTYTNWCNLQATTTGLHCPVTVICSWPA
jgi:hypothetical protein